MPRILVPPEVLIRVSEEAARAAEELETTKNRLDQQITYMMSSWEGTTRSRFFEDFQRAYGEMNKTIEHLRIIGQELKTIAFRFISADMHEDLIIAAAAASAANEPKTFWDHAGDFWQGLQTGAKSVANSVKDTATSLVEDPLGTAKDMAYNATIGTAEEIIDTAVWGGKMIFDADTQEKFAADVEASGGASNYMGQQAAMILAGLATRRIGVKTHPHLKHDSGGDGGKVDEGKIVGDKGNFTVDPAMKVDDERAGVLKNGSYIKNPTSQNINDLITSSGKIGSKQMSGQYMYAVDTNGNIIIGTRAGQRMPHPTLIGGENPQVQAAGIVEIRGGQIYKIDNASGHYKPSVESLKAAEEAFSKLPSSTFGSKFQGYVPFDK
ncbi:WXG100 family type VII secretion target [Paenibacillus lautus]|uniref:WXG100 family type VII secretion target n=1 Tax=Paenibacillus lautus TaxID=1401 RepID=UPI0020D00914|nr:WXG100 family type VII secretion target [Paenibacillus lautus]